MLLKKEQTIIFYGDSITDSNKSSAEGPAVWDVLGTGYVNMINSYYLLYHPELNLRIINQGISGNRTYDLLDRLDKDVLAFNPDHVVMMIGVNDAWRTLDHAQIPQYQVTIADYEKNIDTLVSKMLEKNIQVILMSPFYLEPNKQNVLRQKLDAYNVFLKKYAKEKKLMFIDLQQAFDDLLTRTSIYEISGDRIHLNMAGNTFIKDHVLKHLLESKNA